MGKEKEKEIEKLIKRLESTGKEVANFVSDKEGEHETMSYVLIGSYEDVWFAEGIGNTMITTNVSEDLAISFLQDALNHLMDKQEGKKAVH